MSETSEKYMQSILGQQAPLEVLVDGYDNDDASSLFLQLLRVDSLWNLGRNEEASNLLSEVKPKIPKEHDFFGRGLQSLIGGKLQDAYESFVQASKQSQGLEAVYYGERAVNVSRINLLLY